ncbi:MAG TPA: large conductance mechanosensitive channel protein MscL [Leptolyngbyaceae cyanobacterium M33_DOE_097]|uniref:Large-conductance mechanosensitive channel n=1 Tax=Oscillatoriales cyanobacterium SpSt-418 TaxID=2282169 RepID=A0A7C3PIN1_9CYAN|nr:large conductance mechanosensitive channel protein MscL [Leptolyngbyaceae cyanobacterium M33_DOE_097]
MANGNGGFWADFQKFINQGNVLDLAIAVVLGGAFGKIVSSLVEDVITPALLNPALKSAGVNQIQNLTYNGIKYGLFLSAVINFLLIALTLFILIRAIEKGKRRVLRMKPEEAPPDPVVVQQQTAAVLDRLATAMEQRRI